MIILHYNYITTIVSSIIITIIIMVIIIIIAHSTWFSTLHRYFNIQYILWHLFETGIK